jgi:hypothetical protein
MAPVLLLDPLPFDEEEVGVDPGGKIIVEICVEVNVEPPLVIITSLELMLVEDSVRTELADEELD